jgi:hypothetical protein
MGGAYGNLAALSACLADARNTGADARAFLGDAIGCCGHSEAVVAAIQSSFEFLVAGNHEQQAAAGATSCGCGYASAEDEAVSCEAFRLATEGLSSETLAELASWPSRRIVAMAGGRVLLCHGSPAHTSEFLYECELDDLRLTAWLEENDVRGFVCTHSGLPWVRHLAGGRFALNCGVVGKPDHDGDPAVHYALIELGAAAERPTIEIRRVEYEHEAWARAMEEAGIQPVFVAPVRTGVWTTGVASLPLAERHRNLRWGSALPEPAQSFGPGLLNREVFERVLVSLREMRLLDSRDVAEVLALLSPAFPLYSAARLATSVHVHVKVQDVEALPHEAIQSLGGKVENERFGYVKYAFDSGINLIFSSVAVAEEDLLPDVTVEKPFTDHVGVDLRRETGVVRAAYDDVPELARRVGWRHVAQGGRGRAVYCCHAQVAEKHWVFPATEGPTGALWTRPIEFAYGALIVTEEMLGCDLRPIDPRHPRSGEISCETAPGPRE